MKISPNCSCANRDGSRCGRKVTDGSQPPVCHVHRLQAQGRATSPLIPTADDLDEVAILRKLAKDPKPEVRLRAVDLLLSIKTKKAETTQPASDWDRLLRYATEAQVAELRSLTSQVAAIRESIRQFVEDGGAPRVEPELEPIERPAPVAAAPVADADVEVQSSRGPLTLAKSDLDDAWTPTEEDA